jgi:hypothetical protein
MVKESNEDPTVILFTPGTACQRWAPVPVAMIDNVEWLGKVRCKEHTHHHVRLALKEASGPEAKVLATLLEIFAENGFLLPLAPSAAPAAPLNRQGFRQPPVAGLSPWQMRGAAASVNLPQAGRAFHGQSETTDRYCEGCCADGNCYSGTCPAGYDCFLSCVSPYIGMFCYKLA